MISNILIMLVITLTSRRGRLDIQRSGPYIIETYAEKLLHFAQRHSAAQNLCAHIIKQEEFAHTHKEVDYGRDDRIGAFV